MSYLNMKLHRPKYYFTLRKLALTIMVEYILDKDILVNF